MWLYEQSRLGGNVMIWWQQTFSYWHEYTNVTADIRYKTPYDVREYSEYSFQDIHLKIVLLYWLPTPNIQPDAIRTKRRTSQDWRVKAALWAVSLNDRWTSLTSLTRGIRINDIMLLQVENYTGLLWRLQGLNWIWQVLWQEDQITDFR